MTTFQTVPTLDQAGQVGHQFADAGTQPPDRALDVEALYVPQHPVGQAPEQPHGLVGHRVLERSLDLVVERLDVRPKVAHAGDFPRDRVRPGDAADVGTGVFLRADREARAHAVDEAVGGRRDDDLPRQLVAEDRARIAPLHGLREVARQLGAEVRVLRHVGVHELAGQPDLRIRKQHRQFRPRQPLALAVPLDYFIFGRQRLERTVERARALERAQQVPEFECALGGRRVQARDREALQVVVPEH
jgi:hypothetical protein